MAMDKKDHGMVGARSRKRLTKRGFVAASRGPGLLHRIPAFAAHLRNFQKNRPRPAVTLVIRNCRRNG